MRSRTPNRRAGTAAVELTLVLPIYLLMIGALVMMSMIVTARQEVLMITRELARVASHGGGDREAIEQEVKDTADKLLEKKGRLKPMEIRICWHDGTASPPTRDRVEVVGQVPAGQVVPNLLLWAGFGLGNQPMAASVTMMVE